jgi:hypothetical protein
VESCVIIRELVDNSNPFGGRDDAMASESWMGQEGSEFGPVSIERTRKRIAEAIERVVAERLGAALGAAKSESIGAERVAAPEVSLTAQHR